MIFSFTRHNGKINSRQIQFSGKTNFGEVRLSITWALWWTLSGSFVSSAAPAVVSDAYFARERTWWLPRLHAHRSPCLSRGRTTKAGWCTWRRRRTPPPPLRWWPRPRRTRIATASLYPVTKRVDLCVHGSSKGWCKAHGPKPSEGPEEGKIMDCPPNADEKHTRLELFFSFFFSFFFFQLCSHVLECPSYHKQSGKQIPRRRSADVSLWMTLHQVSFFVFFVGIIMTFFLLPQPPARASFRAMNIRSNGLMHY